MKNSKYINFTIVFFVIISSAIALNNTLEFERALTSNAPPVVSFTFNNNNVCSGQSVSFTSSVTGNSPFQYAWNFGDGGTSTQPNPNHVFQALGCGTQNFNVTLTVTDDNGEIGTTTESITVKEKPSISFFDMNPGVAGPFNNCGNTNISSQFLVEVDNSSTASCIDSYNINWGDGDTENNVNFPISHNYVGFGTYNMTITAIGDNGCSNSVTKIVKNATNPSGGISGPGDTQNLCAPSNDIQFEITNWGTNTSDTTYEIDYGDGTFISYSQAEMVSSALYNAANPSSSLPFPIAPHSYTESSCPGEFVAKLWIKNACAPDPNPATLPNIIIIISPDANFTAPDEGCVNVEIPFINSSESGFGFNCNSNDEFTWDFGDGTSSVTTNGSQNVNHIFTNSGTYTVTLTADNYSCDESTFSKEICIEAPLNPEFTIVDNEGCAPFSTILNNTTSLADQCGVPTFQWIIDFSPSFCGTTNGANFINGTDANSDSPEIEFINPGTYEIILKGTNSCGDFTTSQLIEVKQPPTATLNAIADACGSLSFNPVATVNSCAPASDVITYNWSFPGGAPSTSNQLDPGTISYTTVGDYTVSFSVTNSCGTTTETESFSINESPTITNTDLTQTICSGATITEINILADNPNTTFSWSSNNPTNLTGYTPSGTSNSIPAQTLINYSGSAVTLIYTVIPEINGCAGAPVNFEIIVESAPLITTQPLSNSVCENGTTDDLSVAFQGTGTANYQWFENIVDNTTSGTAITGATSATFTPPTDTVGTTYYYVVITFSSGGCNQIVSDTAEIEVANTTQIDTEPLSTQSLCVGGTAEELSIVVSGGAGVASYQWYSNTTNANSGGTLISGATNSTYTPPIFTSSGTFYYYVEVSYTSNGCAGLISAVSEIVVVDDPVITTEPIAFQSLCQNTTPENLELVVSGGLGTISYQWFVNTVNNTTTGSAIAGANSSTYTPSVTAVGTLHYYCVVSQDISGCEVTSAISEVEVSAGAQFTAQPISDELCLSETTSALTVSYTNGTGTPAYQWYQNTVDDTTTGTAIGGATSATYNPDVTAVGTLFYYVIITFNSGGCSEIISTTAEIIVNETPSISDANVLICSGNTFNYIPDNTTGDIVPLNTMFTWTTPNVNPAGSIIGASEQFSPVATISQFLENTTINPSTVTYTVTPVSGDCIGEDFEVIVTVNPSISVSASVVNNTCFQSNTASIAITIVGGVPFTIGNPYQIIWTGPNSFTSTNENISNLEAGTYTLTIEDDGGCPYSETFTIIEPDILVFNPVDFDPETISCFGANDGAISIDVAGGTLPYQYTWTLNGLPFSTEEDLTNLGPGDYTVSVIDGNSCGPITQSFSIDEPELLEVTLDTKTDVVCYGEATGAIDVTVTGGRLDYTFSWTGPNGFTSANEDIDTLLAGLYNVSVIDNSGCTQTLEVEILQNDQIEIDVTITEIICYGDNDASITINNISGGLPPYDVSWSNFGTGNSQTNLSAGTYTITVTDAENCERAFSIIIDEAPLFLIDPVVTQMSCSGENDASIVLNFVGGIDPVTLVWDDNPTAGTERNNLAPGTYSVTITDGTPCVIQESFTIFNILPLGLSANVADALDCDDTNSGAINLLIQGGTPPFNVVWSNGSITEDLDNVPPNTYVAHITDANGCEIEGSWTVNRFEPLVLNVDTQVEVDCETRSVNQTFLAMASGGVPPFQYNWSSGTVSGTNNELMTTEDNGLVILEVEDSQGCTINYSLNVETPVLGDAEFTTTSFGYLNYGVYAIQDPIEFINTATGVYESVLWDFGDGSFSSEENPVHTYFEVGSYVVTQTVTYPFGCVYTKVVTLYIEEGYKLIMPNAFTPNEDGLNDFFGPVHIGLNTLEISIYDTWGSLIYKESGDSLKGWNGKVKDEVAENGNYYYTFLAKTFYGDEIKKQGAFVYIK